MKRVYNGLLALLALFAFASCENFMDIHKEYIEGGEIIYAPKVDSMVFIAGNHRLEFRYWLYKSPNVRTVDLYWNSGRDSLILPVSPTTGIDSFTTIIPNLNEQSYTFDVRTTDSYGHKSLYMTNFGSAYGENYQSSLAERRINSVDLKEKDGIVQGAVLLFPASTGWVRTEVRYTEIDGATGIASAKASENTVFCSNAKPGSSFEARSLYIPETEAIDTFATAWVAYGTAFPSIYQYDRSDWVVLEVSDETASDGGGKNTLIDGNLGSYWHSRWDGGNVPLPHWAIIDMQIPRNVTGKIDVYRRPGNTDAKTVEIYLSDSPDADGEWTKIGDGQFSSGDLLTIIPTDKVTKGRYLKMLLPDSNRDPFISIAEIYLYGGM